MDKPEVEFRKEPLRYICNEAFFAVKKVLPKKYETYNKTLAFTFGIFSGYLVAEGGAQIVSSLAGSQNFLEELAKDGLMGTWSIPLGSRVIAPKYFKQFVDEHPIYSTGILGVMAGASIRAIQELSF